MIQTHFMKKIIIVALSVICSSVLSAQDTTKVLRHEIGFNAVSIVKQLISNNPASTLPQLPYAVFYNLYFTPQINMRLGFGISNTKTEVSVEGQVLPRTTNNVNMDGRAGVSYNFVRQNRLTFNAFADVLYHNSGAKTVNTQTTQVFGNPVDVITIITSDITTGIGGQIGAGVKYNIYKHLSIYAEVPISIVSAETVSKVDISSSSFPTTSTVTKSKNKSTNIFLPTTIYLVLRF